MGLVLPDNVMYKGHLITILWDNQGRNMEGGKDFAFMLTEDMVKAGS